MTAAAETTPLIALTRSTAVLNCVAVTHGRLSAALFAATLAARLSALMLTFAKPTSSGLASYPKSNCETFRVAFAIKLDPISSTIESAISATTRTLNREPARPVVVPELSFSGSLGAMRLECHAGRLAAIATAVIIAANDSANTRQFQCGSMPLPSIHPDSIGTAPASRCMVQFAIRMPATPPAIASTETSAATVVSRFTRVAPSESRSA